jgi:hypothetical protein
VHAVFMSRYMPCEECGESIERASAAEHECAPGRRADYQLFGLRGELAQLETEIRRHLATPSGRFETWLAARQVRGQG